MALKMTIMEGKGEFSPSRFQENLHIMLSLWDEISQLADFNKVNKNHTIELIKFELFDTYNCY